MKLWKTLTDDFTRMCSDFKNYFGPQKIIIADKFIEQFEKAEEERYNSKDETLKRLKLDRVPCHLTPEDFNGINDADVTKEKYRNLQKYLADREIFEREWK